MNETVQYTVAGGIATVTLNRPQVIGFQGQLKRKDAKTQRTELSWLSPPFALLASLR